MKLWWTAIIMSVLCLLATKTYAQHDAEIMVSANKDTAKVGDEVVFGIRFRNMGKTNLSGVTVRVWISPGLNYMSNTPFAGTAYNTTSQIWTLGNVPSNQYYTTLYIRCKVSKDGVNSIFGEVQTMNQPDIDSKPGNNLFNEDDIEVKSISVPMEFCLGEKISITARGALGFAKYQWYRDNIALKDSTNRQLVISTPGSYTYTVNGSVLGNCQGQLCAPIIVRYSSVSLKLTVTQPKAICGNTVIDLTSAITASQSGGTYTYYNSISDLQNNTNPIPAASVKTINKSQKFFVKYAMPGGCAATDTIRTVFFPTVNAVAASPKAVTCLSSQVVLSTTGSTTGSDITYKWSGPNNFTANSNSPTVAGAGTYTLTVTNTKTGCFAIDTAIVKNSNYAVKVFAGNDTTITKGKGLQMKSVVSGGIAPYKYMWLPPTGLSSSSIPNPIATPQNTITYNLIVTDANGCQGGDLVKITVIPSANGDGNGARALYTMICESEKGLPLIDLNMRLRGDREQGSWSVVSGNVATQFDAIAGILNPNTLEVGTYTFKYTVADDPKSIISEEEVTIKIEACNTLEQPKVLFPTTVIKHN